MIDKDGYRPNVGIVLCNARNEVFWGKRVRQDSWQFFDLLLEKAGVVCTPGAGFGRCGQGYIRISAFNSRENVEKALDRIESALK